MARTETKVTSRNSNPAAISPDMRRHMIGEGAYYRSQQRGFAPGHEMEDWLAAEADFERTHRTPLRAKSDTMEKLGLDEIGAQHGGPMGPAGDDALKRIVKRHPHRDIARVESIEPGEAPLKE